MLIIITSVKTAINTAVFVKTVAAANNVNQDIFISTTNVYKIVPWEPILKPVKTYANHVKVIAKSVRLLICVRFVLKNIIIMKANVSTTVHRDLSKTPKTSVKIVIILVNLALIILIIVVQPVPSHTSYRIDALLTVLKVIMVTIHNTNVYSVLITAEDAWVQINATNVIIITTYMKVNVC